MLVVKSFKKKSHSPTGCNIETIRNDNTPPATHGGQHWMCGTMTTINEQGNLHQRARTQTKTQKTRGTSTQNPQETRSTKTRKGEKSKRHKRHTTHKPQTQPQQNHQNPDKNDSPGLTILCAEDMQKAQFSTQIVSRKPPGRKLWCTARKNGAHSFRLEQPMYVNALPEDA